jgi:uncharacterized protein (DUF488 family)
VALPFFTIGHSNRSLEEFIELLREPRVERIVDVRKVPMSRANPQFNKDALPDTLAASQISYEHIPELGGLRGKAKSLPPDINGLWENRSFHNYADYALSSFILPLFRLPSNELKSSLVCLGVADAARITDEATEARRPAVDKEAAFS